MVEILVITLIVIAAIIVSFVAIVLGVLFLFAVVKTIDIIFEILGINL
ncbi:hypothetical protein LCGC14_2930500 [marine sediment metagenome]|uniref:Uncharacterized protein n=1 Tax=marine sediment metagenome TaxID=412755 RepID=A0A0F8Y7Z0_9ZZZZ